MKMNFKYAALFAAALTLGFTGCSNEDNSLGVDGGTPTEMNLQIAFADGAETKATDANATEAEGKINTVDVFIYNGDRSFNKHVTVGRSSLTPSTGVAANHQYTAKIATTTGPKYFHVGINLPTDVVTAAKNKPMGDLSTTLVTEMSRAQMTTIANGLPMFSTEMAGAKTMAEGENTVTLQVKRLVAKVMVQESGSMDIAGLSAQGSLDGDLEFGINGFNKKQYLVQPASKKDPNWDDATIPTADFDNTPDWVAVNASTVNNVKDYNALYTSENTSKGKRRGEVTRVTVRGKFIPKKVITDAAGTESSGDLAAKTFYAFGDKFFYNKTTAEAYVAANNGKATDILEYTDGYCYWHIFLNGKASAPADRWDVLRNDYLQCTITKIAGVGRHMDKIPYVWPDENDNPSGNPGEEEETPDEGDAKLTATIDIVKWNVVTTNHTLDK